MHKIDFNSPQYSKPFARKEDLLKHYTEYQYLKSYFPALELNTVIHSPLRQDNSPSFSFFYSEPNNCILFKDLATGELGDFLYFIQRLYGYNQYVDVIDQIVHDFNLGDLYRTSITPKPSLLQNIEKSKQSFDYRLPTPKFTLSVRVRTWTHDDLKYWYSFGITLSTLEYFKVYPISHYFVSGDNMRTITIDTPEYTYAFVENQNNTISYKIYRPFAEKTKKWRTDHAPQLQQGYNQLPEKGNILIITKSKKDIMSLYEVAKYPAVAGQSETVTFTDDIITEYKTRFNHVFSLFDNDTEGMGASLKLFKKYKIPGIIISNKQYPNAKDFSDLVLNYGQEIAINVLNEKIITYLNKYNVKQNNEKVST